MQQQPTQPPLPVDLAGERAVLGSILLERDAIIAVASELTPIDFYLEKHALIYEAMLACYSRREPPDLATVAGELRRQERLYLVGGLFFLGELAAEVPTAVHIAYYARGVIHAAGLRRLIEAGGKIAALGYDEAPGLETTYDLAEQTLFGVTQRRGDEGWKHISQVSNELYAALEREDGLSRGVPTGLSDLDELLGGGLQRGDLILLAARPGVGKTALALTISDCAAAAGHVVGVVSQEMSRDQLLQRMVAARTGIDLGRIRSNALRDDEWVLAFEALGVISELPIYVDDQAGKSSGAIRAAARRLAAEHRCDLLVIDYLQLLVGEAGAEANRVQEVTQISRDLKLLARELDAPVLALSQLSRAVENRASKVPQLSDLRESGALEQDADVVLFIYREELYERETDKKGVAEIHVAKHRNGPLGVVPLRFTARTTSFQTLEAYRAPEGY